jgi:hypothetical protein
MHYEVDSEPRQAKMLSAIRTAVIDQDREGA